MHNFPTKKKPSEFFGYVKSFAILIAAVVAIFLLLEGARQYRVRSLLVRLDTLEAIMKVYWDAHQRYPLRVVDAAFVGMTGTLGVDDIHDLRNPLVDVTDDNLGFRYYVVRPEGKRARLDVQIPDLWHAYSWLSFMGSSDEPDGISLRFHDGLCERGNLAPGPSR